MQAQREEETRTRSYNNAELGTESTFPGTHCTSHQGLFPQSEIYKLEVLPTSLVNFHSSAMNSPWQAQVRGPCTLCGAFARLQSLDKGLPGTCPQGKTSCGAGGQNLDWKPWEKNIGTNPGRHELHPATRSQWLQWERRMLNSIWDPAASVLKVR